MKRRGTFNFFRGGAAAPFLVKEAAARRRGSDMDLALSYFSQQSGLLF